MSAYGESCHDSGHLNSAAKGQNETWFPRGSNFEPWLHRFVRVISITIVAI